MFDIGFWELVVIGVVALVVLGPERLPVAIRTASHWIRLIRSTANSVKTELEQELKLQELHNDLKKAEQPESRAAGVHRAVEGGGSVGEPSLSATAGSAERDPPATPRSGRPG